MSCWPGVRAAGFSTGVFTGHVRFPVAGHQKAGGHRCGVGRLVHERGQRARAGAHVRPHRGRGLRADPHGGRAHAAVPGGRKGPSSGPLRGPRLLRRHGRGCLNAAVPRVAGAGGAPGRVAPDAALRQRCVGVPSDTQSSTCDRAESASLHRDWRMYCRSRRRVFTFFSPHRRHHRQPPAVRPLHGSTLRGHLRVGCRRRRAPEGGQAGPRGGGPSASSCPQRSWLATVGVAPGVRQRPSGSSRRCWTPSGRPGTPWACPLSTGRGWRRSGPRSADTSAASKTLREWCCTRAQGPSPKAG